MERTIFLVSPCLGTSAMALGEQLCCVGDLVDYCHPDRDCYVVSQGKVLDFDDDLKPGKTYSICPRLRGGKGGFGSMLRAIGAQIEKTTNREACRDLSGRRMRDVNNEKKMLDYMEKKAEREREREKKKKERLERLTQTPKHFFNDPDYDTKLHEAVENVDKAVEKGIVAHVKKRKLNENTKEKDEPKIKKGLWLGEEEMSSSDSDSDDDQMAALRLGQGGHSVASTSEAGTSCTRKADQQGTSKNGSDMDRNDISQDNGVATNTKDGDSLDTAENVGSTDTNQPGTSRNGSDKDRNDISQDSSVAANAEETKTDGEPLDTAEKVASTDTNHPETIANVTAPDTSNGNESHVGSAEKSGNVSIPAENTGAKVLSDCGAIDLSNYNSAEELEKLGLEPLKTLLMGKGVKCGGSLKERAARLFIVKDLTQDQIDPNLMASKSKKRSRPQK